MRVDSHYSHVASNFLGIVINSPTSYLIFDNSTFQLRQLVSRAILILMQNFFIIAFGMPGGWEWVIIFLAVLLLFGAKRLPELARGIGKSLGEFRKAKSEFDRELHTAGEEVAKEAKGVKKSIEKAADEEESKSDS